MAAPPRSPSVGVLAVQGDFPEHRVAVDAVAGPGSARLVRSPSDLAHVEALLLPGGESTAIAGMLERTGLWEPLKRRASTGLPILGTCAGLILLADEVERSPFGRDPPTLGLLDIAVRRNDFGRQVDSFEGPVQVDPLGDRPFPGVFIRAPRIVRVGPKAQPIAHRGVEVVGVRQRSIWGFTFHPELSGDPRLLASFLAGVGVRAPA